MSESEADQGLPVPTEAPEGVTELSTEQLDEVQGGAMPRPAAAKAKGVVGVAAGAIPSGDLGLL